MSSMATQCGNLTAQVNGFLTAVNIPLVRSKYRTMLNLINDRIQQRLSDLEITARAASLRAGLSADAIRNIERAVESGRDGISTVTLLKLAPILQTTPSWLLEGGGSPESRAIPKLSWVSAGTFETTDAIMSTDEVKMIRVADLPDGDWVALDVIGDSMDRISPPGSLIIVNRSDRRLTPNACYVIEDGEGGATYKRYRPNPDRFEPVSTNPDHEPLFPDQLPRIFGRVRRTILEM